MRQNVTEADSPQDWVNVRLSLHSSNNFWKHRILSKRASPWLGKPPNLITLDGLVGGGHCWGLLSTLSGVPVFFFPGHSAPSPCYPLVRLKKKCAITQHCLWKLLRSCSWSKMPGENHYLYITLSASDSALATNRPPNIVLKFILIFVCYPELLVEMIVIQVEYMNETKCWFATLKPYMIGTQLCTKHLLQVNPTNPVCLIQVGMLNMTAWTSCFSRMAPTDADLHCKSPWFQLSWPLEKPQKLSYSEEHLLSICQNYSWL